MDPSRPIRTRFAPSPTGPLHIGGVRTALYAYLFARRHAGEFLVRVEDTDRGRYVEGAEAYIMEALEWCGIRPDRPVTRQSDRRETYIAAAEDLVRKGHAYYAFDTAADLEQARARQAKNQAPFTYDASTRMQMRNSLSLTESETGQLLDSGTSRVVRLLVQPGMDVNFTDMVREKVSVRSDLIDDKVLLKSDGMPTYHLAHLVDDHASGITHVIRGEEWLPSAPAHVLLYRFMGWEKDIPTFAHLPLLLKPDGKGKLSKRDGERLGFPVFPIRWKDPGTGSTLNGFREDGYYPESFINILALLGWNPGTEQEIFTMDELIQSFSFEHVHKSAARFDPEKARWFNGQWLQRQPDEALGRRLKEALDADDSLQGEYSSEFTVGCARLLKPRVHFENEMPGAGRYLFEDPADYDRKVLEKKWNAGFHPFFSTLQSEYASLEPFDAESLEKSFKLAAEAQGIKPGRVLQLFRLFITGKSAGVDLFPMLELLGRKTVCDRLNRGLEYAMNHNVSHE